MNPETALRCGVYTSGIAKLKGLTLVLGVPTEFSWKSGSQSGPLGELNELSNGALRAIIEEHDFSGKDGETLVVPFFNFGSARTLIFVGMGDRRALSLEKVRSTVGVAVKKAHALKRESIIVALPLKALDRFTLHDIARASAEGAILSGYEFSRYKTTPNTHVLTRLDVYAEFEKGGAKEKQMKEGLLMGELLSKGVCVARDMVNEPASSLRPRSLADEAVRLASLHTSIEATVYTGDALTKLGAGALTAVAQGSDEPAYLVHLKYSPRGEKPRGKICIVGKGVTFDSGGLSIKPESSMETMKMDMAGAAAVLGVFSCIAELKPKVEVHGIIPTCENMVSGKAMRPGDVVKALNGKTIEVLNTDAEGRLILADALSYAVHNISPTHIIDLATLTGACVGALGECITGLFSNNERLARRVKEASEREGERVWELPLVDEYRDMLKSTVADIKNITGSRYGGAITAALFLEEFVGKIPWAHLDIAGPAWDDQGKISYISKGGTGVGVRTILEMLRAW